MALAASECQGTALRGRATSLGKVALVIVRKAVIPAAGLGTRFLPATKAVPKEMLPLVDKPCIQYVVEEAVAAGQEGDEGLVHHRLLAEDDTADRLADEADLVAEFVDLFGELGVGGIIGGEGGRRRHGMASPSCGEGRWAIVRWRPQPTARV